MTNNITPEIGLEKTMQLKANIKSYIITSSYK